MSDGPNFPIIATIGSGALAVAVMGFAEPLLAQTGFGKVASLFLAGMTVAFFSGIFYTVESRILGRWNSRSDA